MRVWGEVVRKRKGSNSLTKSPMNLRANMTNVLILKILGKLRLTIVVTHIGN